MTHIYVKKVQNYFVISLEFRLVSVFCTECVKWMHVGEVTHRQWKLEVEGWGASAKI
jgi:hypothetical protein